MKIKSVLIILFLTLISCNPLDDYIEYSPHEIRVDASDRKQNSENLKKVLDTGIDFDKKFQFILIADSHFGYDELKMAVNQSNKEEAAFLIHMGDSSDRGLMTEYEISNKILKTSIHPVFMVQGNHDVLGTGKEIFKTMYGMTDFSFVHGNSKFIILNDNSWEYPGENVPDLDWLERELSDRDLYQHLFVLTHIPPYTRGFDAEKEERYRDLMKKYRVTYSIHGHNHKLEESTHYNDGIKYLVVDDVLDHNLTIITVDGESVFREMKAFRSKL